jgi:CRISPR-associated protein Csc1
VVRLGKKGCPIRLEWEEISSPIAVFIETPVRPTHAVNPLDVQGELLSYEPLSIPPYLILRVAEIRRDWFVFSNKHVIHIPRRFISPQAS